MADGIKKVKTNFYNTEKNIKINTYNNTNIEYIDSEIMNQEQAPIENIEISDINTDELKQYGFTESDINRVTNGEISIEDLIKEIEQDKNPTRYKALMETQYIKMINSNIGSKYNSIQDIENDITAKKFQIDSYSKETLDLLDVIEKVENGDSLEEALNKTVVGRKKVNYGTTAAGNAITGYQNLNFIDMYGETEELKAFRDSLTETNNQGLFSTSKTHTYKGKRNQFMDKLHTVRNLQAEINQKQEILKYVNEQIQYNLNNIHPYITKDDFEANCEFNSKSIATFNRILNSAYSYENLSQVRVKNKNDMIDVISCILNDKKITQNGQVTINGQIYRFASTDDMLNKYIKWSQYVTDTEKEIFNYTYNTKGADAAYQYLSEIADSLDKRWVSSKTAEDQEFAHENALLSSLGSIFVRPFQGIEATCYSLWADATNQKIRKSGIYSAGDVWRAKVSSDIFEYNWMGQGDKLSFLYNTGMSMADSGSVIALSAATGGSYTAAIFSAGIMGSTAWTSTLNDALDRGLSDNDAVMLAASSAIVETAMESYSAGHLLNLEGKLSESTMKIVQKTAAKTNSTNATKLLYVGASALSQGLCEGEEEFGTEILNYVSDEIISGKLSNHNKTVQNYINQGYNEYEASRRAANDFKYNLKQAFLGGFVSGIGFGSFSGTASAHRVSNQISHNIITNYQSTDALNIYEGLENARRYKDNKMTAEERIDYEFNQRLLNETLKNERINKLNEIKQNAFNISRKNQNIAANYSVVDSITGISKNGVVKINSNEDLSKIFNNSNNKYYGHGTGTANTSITNSIMENGLRCSHGQMYYTTVDLGQGKNLQDQVKESLDNWQHKDSKNIIIVSLPNDYTIAPAGNQLQAQATTAYYYTPNQDTQVQYGEGQYVRPEFILGYYNAEDSSFHYNEKYYQFLSSEEQSSLFSEIKSNYIDIIAKSELGIDGYKEIANNYGWSFPVTDEEIKSYKERQESAEKQKRIDSIITNLNPSIKESNITLKDGSTVKTIDYIRDNIIPILPDSNIIELSNGSKIPIEQFIEENILSDYLLNYDGTIEEYLEKNIKSIKINNNEKIEVLEID